MENIKEFGIMIVVVILIVVLVMWVIRPLFDKSNKQNMMQMAYVPIGYEQYGLRGELLNVSSIDKYFMLPERQIRLHHSGGEMWASNNSPMSENIKDCNKVPCPANGYDSLDTCYKCGSSHQDKMKIPDLHSHVPN